MAEGFGGGVTGQSDEGKGSEVLSVVERVYNGALVGMSCSLAS